MRLSGQDAQHPLGSQRPDLPDRFWLPFVQLQRLTEHGGQVSHRHVTHLRVTANDAQRPALLRRHVVTVQVGSQPANGVLVLFRRLWQPQQRQPILL